MNRRRLLALLTTISAVSASMAQSPPRLTPLAIYPPAGVGRAKLIGKLAATETLHVSVSLPLGDAVGMQRFVDSVSDPANPEYRHFLTPAQVGSRFGLPTTKVQRIASYLTSCGMRIRLVGDHRLSILADATVAQAESAFHTTILEYAVSGADVAANRRLFSFNASPSVPSEIAPTIVSVTGLENFTHPKPLNTYVTPPQIRTLYNLAPIFAEGSHGEGRTIAISNWDGFRLSGLVHEYAEFFLPKPASGIGSNVTVEKISGGAGAGQAQGEGDLDIQAILAVAPLCHLIVYDGGNFDLIGVLTHEANENKADVVTESYGWILDPPTTRAAHNLHLAMSAEGITYMAASGDSGTAISKYPYPMLDPEVLAVGGTTAVVDNLGHRKSETGWSFGGGGWNVITYPFNVLPPYQKGTGVPKNIPFRLVPDLALNADPNTGYVVYVGGSFQIIGGTSGASPTFAGSLGICEQQLITSGVLKADGQGNHRFGRIQDLIYSFNGDPTVFYDVKTGSNGLLPNGATAKAGTGWDFVTGWGAMNFNGFVTKLSQK